MNNKTCLVPGCTREPKFRGLCPGCYQGVIRYIRLGRTTWQKLEQSGKVLPQKRGRDGGKLRSYLFP